MSEEVVISVCTISYNHGKYIAEAIESVLAQKCKYKIEMIISDDASSDNTQEVIKKYANQFPDIIKPIYNTKNLGMQKNFAQSLRACKEKYIAILEGDDYWTDPYKLQKQVDFLEKNEDVVATGHNVNELIANEFIIPETSVKNYKRISLNDTGFSTPCHTCSLVNRNVIDLPEFFLKSPIGDWPLMSLLMTKGDLVIMPDIMGVYRKNTGMWSSQSRLIQINNIILAINLMLPRPEFDDFELFKEHLLYTKIGYIKEVALLTKNDTIPQYDSEINIIHYFENKITELNAIFKNERKLSAKVAIPVLIKTLQAKFMRKLKNSSS